MFALEGAPPVGLMRYDLSDRGRMARTRCRIDDLLQELSQAGSLAVHLRVDIDCADRLFVPGNRHLFTFNFIAMYLEYYCTGAKGRLEDMITLVSVANEICSISSLMLVTMGERIEPDIRKRLHIYTGGELKERLNLSTAQQAHPFMELEDIRTLCSTFVRLDFPSNGVRWRWQMMLWVAILTQTSLRSGAILPSHGNDVSRGGKSVPLRWGMIRIVITRNSDLVPNDITIEFVAPNGKNRESRHVKVVLLQTTEPWSNPVLLFLVLAHIAGAFPPDWTLSDMLSSSVFDATSDRTRVLAFNLVKREEEVFQGGKLIDGATTYWKTNNTYNYLTSASILSRFDKIINNHAFRRSGAIGLKRAGRSLWHSCVPASLISNYAGVNVDVIAQHLRHKWATTTYEVYVGAVM